MKTRPDLSCNLNLIGTLRTHLTTTGQMLQISKCKYSFKLNATIKQFRTYPSPDSITGFVRPYGAQGGFSLKKQTSDRIILLRRLKNAVY